MLPPALANLDIPDDWDFIMVGDGSGSVWHRACGWGCVLIGSDGSRSVWHGAANLGSVNLAEAMAYMAPLCWLGTQKPQGVLWKVHIVTDSEHTAKSGNDLMAAKGPLWHAVDMLRREGLVTYWHFVPRDKFDLNRLVDRISKDNRKALEALIADPQGTMHNYVQEAIDTDPSPLESLDFGEAGD
jgi:ribonuclease HI